LDHALIQRRLQFVQQAGVAVQAAADDDGGGGVHDFLLAVGDAYFRSCREGARLLAHCTVSTLPSTRMMPARLAPVMDWPSSSQPRMTAVMGLSRPSEDTATGGRTAMPRNHRAYDSRAPAR